MNTNILDENTTDPENRVASSSEMLVSAYNATWFDKVEDHNLKNCSFGRHTMEWLIKVIQIRLTS
jgi:hypothetical protein